MSPSATTAAGGELSTASKEGAPEAAEVHIFSGMKDSLTDELRTYWTDDQLADVAAYIMTLREHRANQ